MNEPQSLDAELPTTGFGFRGSLIVPVLRLVRGGKPQHAAAMRTSIAAICRWANDAPAVRLQSVRWLRRQGDAIVFGTPLPPLAGDLLVAHGRILVPAGFTWEPALPPDSAHRAFCAAADCDPDQVWTVWEAADVWQCVEDAEWDTLSRAALRQCISEPDSNAC